MEYKREFCIVYGFNLNEKKKKQFPTPYLIFLNCIPEKVRKRLLVLNAGLLYTRPKKTCVGFLFFSIKI